MGWWGDFSVCWEKFRSLSARPRRRPEQCNVRICCPCHCFSFTIILASTALSLVTIRLSTRGPLSDRLCGLVLWGAGTWSPLKRLSVIWSVLKQPPNDHNVIYAWFSLSDAIPGFFAALVGPISRPILFPWADLILLHSNSIAHVLRELYSISFSWTLLNQFLTAQYLVYRYWSFRRNCHFLQ